MAFDEKQPTVENMGAKPEAKAELGGGKNTELQTERAAISAAIAEAQKEADGIIDKQTDLALEDSADSEQIAALEAKAATALKTVQDLEGEMERIDAEIAVLEEGGSTEAGSAETEAPTEQPKEKTESESREESEQKLNQVFDSISDIVEKMPPNLSKLEAPQLYEDPAEYLTTLSTLQNLRGEMLKTAVANLELSEEDAAASKKIAGKVNRLLDDIDSTIQDVSANMQNVLKKRKKINFERTASRNEVIPLNEGTWDAAQIRSLSELHSLSIAAAYPDDNHEDNYDRTLNSDISWLNTIKGNLDQSAIDLLQKNLPGTEGKNAKYLNTIIKEASDALSKRQKNQAKMYE